MARYRDNLPQLSGGLFLADAGIETDLIFNHGIEIREFAAHTLLSDETGRDAMADYFRSFHTEAREIRKYIIGTVSRLDHPLTPSMKGELAAERFFCGIEHDDVQKSRDEILSTGIDDIRACADLIADSMHQNCHCVLGNEGTIRASKDLFDDLVQVFE